jgi:hypothetical protein
VLYRAGVHWARCRLKTQSASGAVARDLKAKATEILPVRQCRTAPCPDFGEVFFGLAFLDDSILPVAAAIGLRTFVMVTLGVMVGRVLGVVAGKSAG